MSNRKKVALLVETSNAYARGILKGINRYQQVHQDWAIFFPEQVRGAVPPSWLKDWNCQGVIARIENAEIAEFIENFGVPTVDVSSARQIEKLPWVETNDEVIGQMGAQHLINRGFRNLAFIHEPSFNWSTWRLEAFRERAREHGLSCEVFEATPAYSKDFSWSRDFERLGVWLKQLPKPTGVMACYDIKGRQVLEACNEVEIAVPEELAVLGVDNDSLICEASHPPLTSISLNSFQAGYVAASILDQLMNGIEVTQKTIRIDPIELVERLSTDTIAVDDKIVADALKYIREHATRNIRVVDIIRELDVSRRKLENRFKKIVGHTPHEEIQRRRMEQVKRLLRFSDFSISKIAKLTGYDHAEYLSVAFQRETGMRLTEFREADEPSQLEDLALQTLTEPV